MKKSLEERFWEKVDRENGPHIAYMDTPCWQWVRNRTSDGYGRIRGEGKMACASHVAMQLEGIDVPGGMCCLHRCDNPSCVRPDHLFIGSHLDNRRDCARKGRTPRLYGDKNGARIHPESRARGERHGSNTHQERRAIGDRNGARRHPESVMRGERHGNTKLTEKKVESIRALYATKKISQRKIARMFMMGNTAISNIVRNKTWRNAEYQKYLDNA